MIRKKKKSFCGNIYGMAFFCGMKLILLTAEQKLLSECYTLELLIDLDFDYLHIRKEASADDEYVARIINRLPKAYRPKIVLHGHPEVARRFAIGGLHHKSSTDYLQDSGTAFQTKTFHSIQEIKDCKHPYQYGFLSPIFDSISKKGYLAAFEKEELREFLGSDQKPFPIIALGGIHKGNIQECKDLGFDGVAVLGTVWHHLMQQPKIQTLQEICELVKK